MYAVFLVSNFYSALATSVLFLHALFIVWLVFGALLAQSCPILRWLHITSQGILYGTASVAMRFNSAGELA
jgi:hypothetical protein